VIMDNAHRARTTFCTMAPQKKKLSFRQITAGDILTAVLPSAAHTHKKTKKKNMKP